MSVSYNAGVANQSETKSQIFTTKSHIIHIDTTPSLPHTHTHTHTFAQLDLL